MTQPATPIVSLAVVAGRRPTPVQRVVYELARRRVADLREPPPALASLARRHD